MAGAKPTLAGPIAPAAGDAAAQDTATSHPFHVFRSRMGNLPVYTDIRNGNTKKVTVVRKYSGDAIELGRRVEAVCQSPVKVFHGRIEVKGHHKPQLVEWLESAGF